MASISGLLTLARKALTAGTATYTMPTDTIDLIEHQIRTGTGTNQVDTNVERISVSTYAQQALRTLRDAPLKFLWTVRQQVCRLLSGLFQMLAHTLSRITAFVSLWRLVWDRHDCGCAATIHAVFGSWAGVLYRHEEA